MRLVPKNWRDFQHYSNRSPPWIRLQRKLLDDKDFHRLPVASRALAPMLWLLASESVTGEFDGDPDEIAFRLRTTVKEIEPALSALIDKGFFLPAQVASTALADGVQVAPKSCPETETETETLQRVPTVLVGSAAEPPYRVPSCPHEEIAKAYAELLPTLPQVAVMSDVRKGHVTARWREICADGKLTRDDGLAWFRDFFAVVARSPFLTGHGKPSRDTGRTWAADFDWLFLPGNFVKVVEGRYQERKAA